MDKRMIGSTIIVIGALGACGDSSEDSPSAAADAGSPPMLDAGAGADDSKAASDLFWTTYHENQYAKIPEVQSALNAAIAKDPNRSELYAYLGATHFWHIGEFKRDAKPDMAVLQQDFPSAIQLFQKASELDPNEDHLPGFIGVTMVHAGQLTNNADLIAKGDQLLESSVYRFAEFNNFNQWAAHNADAKDSASYKKALDSLWALLDACFAASVDRTTPDVASYVHLQTPTGRKKVCWWGNELAPYAWEGVILNLGNGLVKAGRVDTAKIVYDSAKLAPNYATWPYRAEFESVVGSDLNARAALYADSDTTNDPPLSIKDRGCVYCHAQVPEP